MTLSELARRVRFLLHRERFREELEEEMRFHVAQRGRRDFGNPGVIEERARDEWGFRWLDDFGQDLRYALRALARSPGFAIAALATLALGIGATTAVFSAIDAALLRPLPFRRPDRLVVLNFTFGPPPAGTPKGYLDYTDWQARADLFQGLAIYNVGGANLLAAKDPIRIGVGIVNPEFFATLGATPFLGRTFTTEEAALGRDQVMVLSYQLWRGQFGADSGVLGRTVTLQNLPYTIIGVMPRTFGYPRRTGAWIPNVAGSFVHWDMYDFAVRLTVVGRLKDGVSIGEAQSAVTTEEQAWVQDHPSPFRPPPMRLVPLRTRMVGGSGSALLVLFGAVGFILLIACTNTAGLLLARSVSRQHEMALRAVLGASRRRVLRQLLTESGVLATCGGVLALGVAWGVSRVLAGLLPAALVDLMPMQLDARVLEFGLLATLVATILFGLAPALSFSVPDLQGPLQRGGGRVSSARVIRVRGILATGEIALTLVVLVGAILLLKSLHRLQGVDPGFRPSGVVAMNVSLTTARYPNVTRQGDFYRRALARLGAVPGVTAAGAVSTLPASGDDVVGFRFRIGAEPADENPDQMHYAQSLVVTPGYFGSLGIPLIRGRDFGPADDSAAAPVMIINRTMAEKYWPGADPLGTRVTAPGRSAYGQYTIIGIVGDVQEGRLGEANPIEAQTYLPLAQHGGPFSTFVVLTALDAATLAPALRRAMADVDPTLPLYDIRTMSSVLASSIAPQTLTTTLLTFAGGLAIVIAAVGLYGVIAYGVAQRSRELGIRLALGARKDQLLRLILRDAVVMTGTGVVLGLGAAWLMTRSLAHLLFQVEPRDPGAFALATLVLTAVTLCAAYVPASRAARVDPMTVLRWE